jgi:hypothetical protein
VALSATDSPVTDGFGVLVTLVVVDAGFTVWPCAAEVLPVYVRSPP